MSTVTVCSKLPFGLQLEHGGKTFRIDGANKSSMRDFNGCVLPGAVAVTDVDAQLWSAWLEANPTHEFVRKGLVFSQKDRRSADAEIKEKEKVLSGLQGISQDMKDSRLPKGKFNVEKATVGG